MDPSASDVAKSVGQEATNELFDAFRKIQHCVGQLDEDQLWRQPGESMNSIANLLLHLSGNVGQWIVSGVGGAEDVRDRPAEFAAQKTLGKSELLRQLDDMLTAARQVLEQATPGELLRKRRVQGFDVTGLQAIFESVAHFRGHTQEIVHITRQLLGDAYRFDFVPSTPEQGAPREDV